MLTGITPARMARLCLKELRESLRDRRTIVTLVLMPLLVYPLLSLVLNRILLTSQPAGAQSSLRIGIGEDVDFQEFSALVMVGYELLKYPEAAPVFLEKVVTEHGDAASKLLIQPADALPFPDVIRLTDDGKSELRENDIDLVVLRKSASLAEESKARASESGAKDESALSVERPLEAVGRSAIGSYDVRYRDGDPHSERALQLLERILAAINNRTSEKLLGGTYETPFRIRATPVAIKSSYANLLATMVPLVLVLMTMAGAVYPAIDLTAGERERGTMESLIVAPTPSAVILLAKYSAVVTVALLTALANLGAMTITLWVSGIGKMVFGDGSISFASMGTILLLLVLFTMFFAALLLAVTSFAKSFKEAQAYLIPLMLLALTPGVMSLLPGIKFTTLLATVPLVNIVLLAREVLGGAAEWNTALVAVICNTVYACAALIVASRLFGSDASMQGSKGSWRDLMLRPSEKQDYPTVDQMALTMAVMFPLYFIASSSLPRLPESLGFSDALSVSLWFSAAVSFLLIFGVPLFAAWFRNIRFATTFRLRSPSMGTWAVLAPAILLVGSSSWIFAHEIFMFGQQLFGKIELEHIARVAEFQERLKQVPLSTVILALAVTPAICEEVLFRGFILGSLSRLSPRWAIVLSAVLFGLMHVLTSNVLAVERLLPTTFMGLILGWIAVRTQSLWPGMLLHALHNALLLSLGHFEDQLKSWGILVEEGEHLPGPWLAGGALALLVGLGLIAIFGRRTSSIETNKPDSASLPIETA